MIIIILFLALAVINLSHCNVITDDQINLATELFNADRMNGYYYGSEAKEGEMDAKEVPLEMSEFEKQFHAGPNGYYLKSLIGCRKRYLEKKSMFNLEKIENQMSINKAKILVLAETNEDKVLIEIILGYYSGESILIYDVDEKTNDPRRNCKNSQLVFANPNLIAKKNIENIGDILVDEEELKVVLNDYVLVGSQSKTVITGIDDCGNRKTDTKNVKFDKVILVLRDAMWSALRTYLKSGYMRTIEDLPQWEEESVEIMQKDRDRKNILNRHSEILNHLSDNQIHEFRIEDLITGNIRKKTLKDILDFINFKADDSKMLSCAISLTFADKIVITQKRIHKTTFELAYSGDAFYCSMQKNLANGSYTLHRPVDCSSENMLTSVTRMCRSKFGGDKAIGYRTDEQLKNDLFQKPIALLSGPSEEQINTRILVEYASGILTGSIGSSTDLADKFAGENFCGLRLALMYAYPPDVTLIKTKSGQSNISLNSKNKKKCLRGTIRGFGRGILIVQDPFVTIWEKLEDYREKMKKSPLPHSKHQLAAVALNFTINFDISEIFLFNEMKEAHDMLDGDNLFILSYEVLMNNVLRAGNRYEALNSMLKYIGHKQEEIDVDKLKCSFTFIDETAIERVKAIVNSYLEHPHLICKMKNILNSKFVTMPRYNHHLFNTYLCPKTQ